MALGEGSRRPYRGRGATRPATHEMEQLEPAKVAPLLHRKPEA
jgi:hypothetical protein